MIENVFELPKPYPSKNINIDLSSHKPQNKNKIYKILFKYLLKVFFIFSLIGNLIFGSFSVTDDKYNTTYRYIFIPLSASLAILGASLIIIFYLFYLKTKNVWILLISYIVVLSNIILSGYIIANYFLNDFFRHSSSLIYVCILLVQNVFILFYLVNVKLSKPSEYPNAVDTYTKFDDNKTITNPRQAEIL